METSEISEGDFLPDITQRLEDSIVLSNGNYEPT
jgi:hypothetical protein